MEIHNILLAVRLDNLTTVTVNLFNMKTNLVGIADESTVRLG